MLAIPKAIFQTLSVDGRLGIYEKRVTLLLLGHPRSCNSSATLPLVAGASRGGKCGRFNNFVELSTHTLILRLSGGHECGRRIAGTVRKHSGFQFARMEGDMKERCLCTKGVPGAQKCHSEHKVVVGKKESWLQMYGE